MSTVSSNEFRQNTFSNAIGGIIAAAVITTAGWIWRRTWLPTAKSWAAAVWSYMRAPGSLPHWAIFLLVLAAGLIALVVVIILVDVLRTKNQPQSPPDWMYYKNDIFFGLKWVWSYDEDRRVQLTAVLCPICDYQLGPNNPSMFDSRVRFYCNGCGRNYNVEGESWESLKSVVQRLIERNLRNGKYPKRTSGP